MPAHKERVFEFRFEEVKKSIKALVLVKVLTSWWEGRTKAVHSKNYTQLFAIVFGSMMFVIGSYLTITGYIIPKIRALSETTKRMPTDFSFAATGYDNGSGTTFAISSEVRLATSSSWWNGSFTKKKDLTVTNVSGNTATSGGTMKITVNTKELVDGGSLLATGDDLRIVYSTQSGTFVELPRALSAAANTTISTSPATQIAFPLQSDLLNASSSASYAMYYGNANATAPSFPKEKYLSFDGGDYVEIPDYISDFSEFTVSVWFKTTTSGTSNYNTYGFSSNPIFQRYISSSFDGGEFGLSVIGGKLTASYNLSIASDFRYIRTSSSVNDGNWHQAAYVVKAANYFALFLDGQLVGQTNISDSASTINAGSKIINIGKMQYWGSPAFFNGSIDDVKIWNKALSGTELSSIYSSASDISNSSNITGQWKFDEVTGQTVADSSGNGNNGTLGLNSTANTDDPTWATSSQSYSIGSKNATLVCPFNGTTTCVGGQTPTTETGAIRYATSSAMVFDGVNDQINVSTSNNLSISAENTIGAWVKLSNCSTTQSISQNYTDSNNWVHLIVTGSGQLHYQVLYNGTYYRTWANCPALNTYHFIVGTFNGSTAEIYIDGVSSALGHNNSSYLNAVAGPALSIGGRPNTTFLFQGAIDEYAIYNRALSQSEITAQYNGGNPAPVQPSANAKLIYHFDENGDDPRNTGKVIDASGNGNNGTITGAKYVNDSPVKNGSFASHEGVFIEEGTTNLAVNPSFEANITDSWAGKSAFNYTSSQVDADGNTLIASNTIKDVFFYDTTRDADGGAWRNNATAKASSWYNEAFSTTRGKKREFPEKAWIVATDSSVDIIDATENKLWMRFNRVGINGNNDFGMLSWSTSGVSTSVNALNSRIYVGRTDANYGGLSVANFIGDNGWAYKSVTTAGVGGTFNGNISQRNQSLGFLYGYAVAVSDQFKIVQNSVNDVYAAVVNGKTYVAVATDGGVSVINETDGTVINSSSTLKYNSIWLTNVGEMYAGIPSPNNVATNLYVNVYYDIQSKTNSFSNNWTYSYQLAPTLGKNGDAQAGTPKIFVTQDTSTVDGTSNTLYLALSRVDSNLGNLAVVQEKQGDETNGSVKLYRSNYISEEMYGDTRGMWPLYGETGVDPIITSASMVYEGSTRIAELAVGNLVRPWGGSGGSNGEIQTADYVNGVRGTGLQFDGTGDYLKQKMYLDQTGATWGAATNNLSLANGSAFFRAGETLGSELLSNTGFETAGAGGSDVYGVWVENASDGLIADETVNFFSGNHAAKVTTGATSSTTINKNITLTPGQIYKLSWWTRGDGTNKGRVRIWNDTTGDVWSDWQTGTGTTSTSYTQFSKVFVAPNSGTNYFYLYGPVANGGVAYFDDISIKQVTSPKLSTYKGTDTGQTPYMIALKDSANKTAWGYLGNSDAGETTGSEITANGTMETGTPPTGWPGTRGSVETETSDVYSGLQALKFTRDANDVTGYVSSSSNSLVAGKLYKISAKVKNVTTTNVRLLMGTSTEQREIASTNVLGSYQFLSGYYTAITSGNKNIIFSFTGAEGNIGLIDDVSIKEVTDTQIDGVHIMSTRNGTTRNWAGIETGFNYNDTAYTFEVRKTDFQITSGDYSMGIWFKRTRSGNFEYLMSKGTTGGSNLGWGLYINNSDVIGITAGGVSSVLGTRTVADTNWHQMIFTKIGTTGTMYIDGTVDTSGTMGSPADNTLPFVIGADWNGSTRFSGTIDEPFVTADGISSAQVLDMYNKGLGALNHATKTDQKLAGTSNMVNTVWASPDNTQIYIGTGGAGGAVSIIKNGKVGNYTDSDSVVKSFTTGTTPALVSNDVWAIAVASASATTPQMIVASPANGISVLNSNLGATSRVTALPYFKFGLASLKLDNSTSYLDTPFTFSSTLTNASYTLSAYLYKDGNQVTSADAILITDDQPSTASATVYTDMGGGWTRVSASFTGQAKAGRFGVQVKAGKTIYADGVQLEQKAYTTTYCDGSMGTGYSWSGTVNNSSSVRTISNVIYPTPSGVFGNGKGTVSIWYKPSYVRGYALSWMNSNGPGSNWGLKVYAGNFTFSVNNVSNVTLGSVTKAITVSPGNWYNVVATWNNETQQLGLCVNGSCATPGVTTGTYAPFNQSLQMHFASDGLIPNGEVSDLRAFDQALTDVDATSLYREGLQTHSNGSERIDKYVSSGTYTSAPLDLGANGEWGMTPIAFSDTKNGGTVSYETRSSADGMAWSAWQAVNGSTVQSDPRRYLQWKANIGGVADLSTTPVINGMTVSYIEDTTAPVNPDQVALGFSTNSTASADLVSNNWNHFANPKFTWNSGVDEAAEGQSVSGLAGYHVLLTTDASATPSANTSDDCYEYVTANAREFVVGSNPSACNIADGTYYLRLQTKDNAGNIASPVTSFTYKYDGTIPKSPASVSSTVVGYTSQNTFTFYWPAALDQGPSGVAGYEFKTGATSGDYSDWTFTTGTEAPNITAYQEGQNFFFVRTVDLAGNPSASTSNLGVSPFYYNASAPTKPTNVNITPNSTIDEPSENNVFSVTWDKPATYSGEISKYYYCVNCTPSLLTMTQATPAETAARKLTDMSLATQQGKNTLYIVAEDNNINNETAKGNVNFEAYASVDFYASTIAPAAPTSLTVSDASDRDTTTWRLTLAWKQPNTGGVPVRYDIYRSEDDTTFTKKGSTTSTAYTDADLDQSSIYYYKVTAIDNAGASSIASNTVNMSPEGKYSTPPVAGGVPSVVAGSSTGLVSWTTSREAFGSVEFGKGDTYGSTTSESKATKSHAIKITGLTPGETYHFRVQNLDDSGLVGYDRSAAYSGDYSFTTLSSPSVTDVLVTDQTLSSAVINWSSASLATSMVEYGATTAYGTELSVPTNPGEALHSARIADLEHSMTYHFRIRGTDVDGNDIISDDYTLATLTYPKVTAMVLNTDQGAGGTSIVLAWATNVPTTGEIEYQGLMVDNEKKENTLDVSTLTSMSQAQLASVPTLPKTNKQQVYSGKLESKHVMRLSNLEDGAIYVFTLRGRDEHGNEVVSDPIRYVTGNDTRPPVISNVIIETPMSGVGSDAKTSIIVSWDTDEPAIGQVQWGTGTGTEYSSATEKDQGLTTKHVMVIRDLQPTSSYHLKITSSDKTGNLAVSKDTVVVTPTSQEAAFDVILKNLEDVFGFLKL